MPHFQGQESTRSWSSTDRHHLSCHYHCRHKSRIYMAQPAKYARHQTSCREFSSLHLHPVCWWFNDKSKTDLQPYGFGMQWTPSSNSKDWVKNLLTKYEINVFICLLCPLCSENIWSFIFSYFLESFVPYCAPLLERLSNQATEKAEGFWNWPCSCRRWASWQYGALCQVWCVHHIMLYRYAQHGWL